MQRRPTDTIRKRALPLPTGQTGALVLAGLGLQACGGASSGGGSGSTGADGTGSGGTGSGGTTSGTHGISTAPMAAPSPGTAVSLSRTGGTYTLDAPANFALGSGAGARLEVADAIGNGYAITLRASGTGTLEVDFVDAGDTMTLEAGSTLAGFTILRVRDGTLDTTDADLGTIARVEVASGVRLSVPQLRTIPTLYTASEDGRFVIEVASTAEAEELRTLLSSDSLLIYGGTVDLVAAPSASITPLALNAFEVEASSFVRDPDAPPPGALLLNPDRAGNLALGTGFGDITVTQEGTRYVFTPATGAADRIEAADVGSIIVTGRTLTGDAVVLDEETVTGSGNVAITRLEGDGSAILSNISVAGTKRAFVTGDVTFTGELGSFATTVAAGKTFSAAASLVSGRVIDGAGAVAISALDDSPRADLGDITATAVTAVARLANETVTFAGDLGKAAVTIYGTTGGARDIFNVDGATMGTATFSVAADAVLQGRASKLSGITGAGAGTIEVTALESTPAADLSLLNATTVTAAANLANQTVAFTGKFGKAAVTISGASGGAADVFNIDGATMGTATFAVGPDATLQGAAAKFSGVTVTGTGTVDVTNFTADANLSGLANELGVIVQIGTNGLDISTNANLGSVDTFNLAENVSVTMTSAQNARLNDGIGTNTVTLSDRAAETTGNVNVEAYVLANVAQNIFILGRDDQNVTGAAGQADTVRTGARTTVTGNLALGGTGTDILEISTTGTNISAATTTEVEQVNLADGVAATMTRAQHDKIGTAAGTNVVTLTDSGTITAKAAIEGYVLANDTGNDITLTAAGQDVTGAAAHADTVRTGTLAGFVGTVLDLGSSGTDTIIVGQTGTDLSGINAGAATTAETLVITGLALTTMTTAQHAAFSSITATGTEAIAFSNIAAQGTTGVAAIETYAMVDLSGNDFTIGTGAQNVTGAASHADTVRTGAQTTVTGTFALGNSGTDVLEITTTGTNISGATVTQVEAINLATDVNATIAAAQHARLGTATGTNTITFSDAATVTGNAQVEGYVLATAAGNVFTIGAAGQDVTGSANDDRFNTGQLTDLTGTTIVSGGGADTLGITTSGTNISGINAGAVTGASILGIDNIAAVSMTAAQYAGFTTINALGTNTLTLTTAIAGGTINPGIETLVVAAGTNAVTTMTEGQTVNARALIDGQVLTLAGSHNVTVQLSLGDLTSTSSGAVRVEGGDGSNVITTGAGNDVIIGGDGNDTINAGGGTLNQILFGDALVSGTAGTVRGVQDSVGTDTVTFVVATDEFVLDETIFGPMGNGASGNGARLAANQFHAQAGTGAITNAAFDVVGNGAFIFDTAGGDLYFVQSGATFTSGTTALTDLLSAQSAYMIVENITITGTLAADDFLIVA